MRVKLLHSGLELLHFVLHSPRKKGLLTSAKFFLIETATGTYEPQFHRRVFPNTEYSP